MPPDGYETWKSTKTTKTWYYPLPRKANPPPPPPPPPSPPNPPSRTRSPPFRDYADSPRSRSLLNLDNSQPVSRVSVEYGRAPERRPRDDDHQERSYDKGVEERDRPSRSPRRPERRPRTPSPASSSDRYSSHHSYHSEEWGLSPKAFTFGALASTLTLRRSRDRVRSKTSGREERRSRSKTSRNKSNAVYIGNDGHRYVRTD
ncbi:hypothetical protein LTR84_008928 [Exophiala bonariae]|uniref:Uncharacterized protein n=1 Tax=Exophiala bonariae TaxID=1690606 RepID=A0AAV9MYL3_9EURO|nr:hypothetical protein LTR84_008928 [Exophiala bonariae]